MLTENYPISADAAERQAQDKLAEQAASYPGYALIYDPNNPDEYDEDPEVVTMWQQRMADLGYTIEVDGYFGDEGALVATQFQEQNGLAVNGNVDPETWAASFSLGTPIAQSETISSPIISADAAERQAQDKLYDPSNFDVKLRTFIPSEAIGVPYPSNSVNGANNRGFSSSDDVTFKSSQSVSLDFSSNGTPLLESINSDSDSGVSTLYSKDDASEIDSWRWDLDEDAEPIDQTQLDPANIKEPEVSVSGDAFSIDFDLSGINPLPPPASVGGFEQTPPNSLIPGFNADLELSISQEESGIINYNVEGSHDGFPAYELYIDNTLVYAYNPIAVNSGPLALVPPQDVSAFASGTIAPDGVSESFPSNREVAFGTTDGNFDTITPDPSDDSLYFIEGENTNQLNFSSSASVNSFIFEGFEGEELFEAQAFKPFVVGTFTYQNGEIADSNSDSSDEIYTFNLEVSADSPFSGGSNLNFNGTFTEELTLNVTPNTGNTAEENADIISSPRSFDSFGVFEGETANVEVLGVFEFGRLDFAGFGEILSGSDTGFLG